MFHYIYFNNILYIYNIYIYLKLNTYFINYFLFAKSK